MLGPVAPLERLFGLFASEHSEQYRGGTLIWAADLR
jgi:hypothetical protein